MRPAPVTLISGTMQGSHPPVPLPDESEDRSIDWAPLAAICASTAASLGIYRRATEDLRSLWSEFKRTRFPFAAADRQDIRWAIRRRAFRDICLMLARSAPPPGYQTILSALEDTPDEGWRPEGVEGAIRAAFPGGIAAAGARLARGSLHGILGFDPFEDPAGPAVRLNAGRPRNHGGGGRARLDYDDAILLVGQMHWITHLGRAAGWPSPLPRSSCAPARLPGPLRRLMEGGNPKVPGDRWQPQINEQIRGWRIARPAGGVPDLIRRAPDPANPANIRPSVELLLAPAAMAALDADRAGYAALGLCVRGGAAAGFPAQRGCPARAGRGEEAEIDHA